MAYEQSSKELLEAFETFDADFFCLQETKLQAGQIELDLPGYTQYWNYAERKDTLVQRSLLKNRHLLPIMGLASRNMMPKAG